jgi:acetyl-CoA carboxylase carboxyl transferase subunit alpha
MPSFLDFEKPIAELQSRIDELRETAAGGNVDTAADVQRLQAKSDKLLRDTFAKLTPWQKTQVARHPERPHFKDYVAGLFDEWLPLAGDRAFADDQAIIGGFATFRGRKILAIGHEKGEDTASRLRHNFGMGKPEGYRKAIRLVELADRFGLPVVTLVDTSGAFPGIQAEERGQAEAIARSTEACLAAGVPVIAAIVGEGGSGGAVALAAGNRVLLEMTLHEGRKHIVRRMLDGVGHPVRQLVRTRIGPVQIGTLRAGRVRHLTRVEVGALYKLVGL